MKIAYSNKSLDSYSNLNSCQALSYHSIIEIQVSCKNLMNLDDDNEINPMCIIFSQKNDKFLEEDRTEVIKNNSNPNFTKIFKTYYIFDSNQPIRFDIYNCNADKSSFKIHEFIGYYETDVYHIVSNLNQSLTFDLLNDKNKGKRGQIVLKCQQAKESNYYLQGEIQVNKLKKMKTFAKNSPFFEISRPSENGINMPVYRSKVNNKCQSCIFKEFMIPLHVLCQHNIDEPITITFYDHQNKRCPKFIGKYESSIRFFMDKLKIHIDLKGEILGKKVGNFCFNKLEIIKIPTVVDYLESGVSLNMITAIDFTSSNGDPKNNSSLHYISNDPNQLNEYQKCIMSVGSVLSNYVNTQKYAVYGFGAKVNKKMSHCFPLTFDSENVEVNGIQGINDVYTKAVKKVSFALSTKFARIIKEAIKVAIKKFEETHAYSILFILTDSVVNDMQDTINQIIEASEAPLSIIIIGIGNTNFSNMYKLDSENQPLNASNGKVMKRDIVRFVQLCEIKDTSSLKIENEVLKEIPIQIHQFYSLHGNAPKIDTYNSCFL